MAAATRAARSRGVRASFLALALATAVWAIAAQWDGVIAGLREVTPAVLALAFTLGVAYVWVTMAAWRVVLLALGAPVPNTVTRTIFFVSQVAKYLPGGVWNIVAAAEMGADHEISRRRSVSAMAISLLLTVITGLMLACAVVLWGPSELRERYGWIVVLLPLLLLTLSPWALNRVLAVVGQGSEGPAMRVRLGTVITAGLLTILSWTLAGSQLYLLATSMGLQADAPNYLLCLGGYALAWVVGFLFIVAPAGVGVREAALGLVLAGALPEGAIVAVVLLSRVLLTLADLGLGGWAGLAARRRARRSARGRA
ncbi:lysylphosphatidylglycerol synthase domain-containing protein [Serinibacter salmoneus]|nr:lysylphosphatidylglycerol synthase domain-containing protein [Serinibacter salmoneus]